MGFGSNLIRAQAATREEHSIKGFDIIPFCYLARYVSSLHRLAALHTTLSHCNELTGTSTLTRFIWTPFTILKGNSR